MAGNRLFFLCRYSSVLTGNERFQCPTSVVLKVTVNLAYYLFKCIIEFRFGRFVVCGDLANVVHVVHLLCFALLYFILVVIVWVRSSVSSSILKNQLLFSSSSILFLLAHAQLINQFENLIRSQSELNEKESDNYVLQLNPCNIVDYSTVEQ